MSIISTVFEGFDHHQARGEPQDPGLKQVCRDLVSMLPAQRNLTLILNFLQIQLMFDVEFKG